MTDLNRVDSSNLDALTAVTGAVVLANRNIPSGGTITALGCTLASGTTYFFPLGSSRSPVPAEVSVVSAHVRWDAAAILTITIETSVFPSSLQGGDPRTGTPQLTHFDTTPGFWLLQNPPTAYVPVVGGIATAMTVAVAGGTAGGCEFDLGNLGPRRGHVKIVVGGTGGVVRVGVHGKAAA